MSFSILYCENRWCRLVVSKKYRAFDSVSDFSELSNSTGAQNFSYLGLFSRDICAKNYVSMSVPI